MKGDNFFIKCHMNISLMDLQASTNKSYEGRFQVSGLNFNPVY